MMVPTNLNFFVELTELVLEVVQPEPRLEQRPNLVQIDFVFMTSSLTTVPPVAFEPKLSHQLFGYQWFEQKLEPSRSLFS